MLVIAQDRRAGSQFVHYLPEGRVLRLGEDVLLSRAGNHVIVQTEREKYTLEAPASLNMTEILLRFVPLDAVLSGPGRGDPLEVLRELERAAWSEEMPEGVRRFVRLYAALHGLRILDSVPQSYREAVVLTVSRLTGEPVGRIASDRKELMEKIRREIEATLEDLRPEHVTMAVNAVIAV